MEKSQRAPQSQQPAGNKKPQDEIAYDLKVKLREGTIWPADGMFAAIDVTGDMRLTPTELILTDMKGRRGRARLAGSGAVNWGANPVVKFNASSKTCSSMPHFISCFRPPARRLGSGQT